MNLRLIRDLRLGDGSPVNFLSAASGLVVTPSNLFVVADDELHLGIFPNAADEPGRLLRLFEGTLPAGKAARKARKPDLEALTLLPRRGSGGHWLVAFGSGSGQARHRAAAVPLDRRGGIAGDLLAIDLSPMHERLSALVPDLNIEGAVVRGAEICFFQRGNRRYPHNLVIALPLEPFLAGIETGIVAAVEPSRVERLELGDIDGTPFSVTDAALLDDGLLVSAVAEATDSAYADGDCLGAMLALLNFDMRPRRTILLPDAPKVEGIWAAQSGSELSISLVTDPDDRTRPAVLYRISLPSEWLR